MRLQRLSDRLQVLERARSAMRWSIVDLVHALVGTQERHDADVIALEVGGPGQPRARVLRRPGEALSTLCRRACPGGDLSASPAPIFVDRQAGESEAGEALRLMLGMSRRLRQMVAA